VRKIQKPNDAAEQVYLTCIGNMKEGALKTNMISVSTAVQSESNLYDDKAQAGTFFEMPKTHVNPVIDEQLKAIYGSKFSKKGQPGRFYYDKLKSIPYHGICPLCGQRVVSTLDHYLPKAHFPLLSVVPINLIPACSECNKTKMDRIPLNASDQTLHPYFDDVDTQQWLFATVYEENPLSLRFYANPPAVWEGSIKARIQTHFEKLGLAVLYTSHSGAELVAIKNLLEKVYFRGGVLSVRDQLRDMFESYEARNVNSWQTAMYQALMNSEWYCSGGFSNI